MRAAIRRTSALVVNGSGELAFFVRSARDLDDAGLTVTIADDDGARHAIAMTWIDRMNGFAGRMERGTPARGDAEILLVHSGRRVRADARIARILPRAEHRGAVIRAGDLALEVVVQHEGRAEVYVLGRTDTQLELTVSIPSEGGSLHPLSLVWDPDRECYSGRIEGVVPRPGAFEVIAASREVGRGYLFAIASQESTREDALEDLRLTLPELGSDLPAVIPIPPE